ncbi:MAG: serine/threonine-protein phosphatase [Thermoguttaceae bacterium]|nr:serine/threonine-protein phosphatase [Thermoguttaceae bacterium]
MDDNWRNESIAFSARTDVGMRRSNNQDHYCVEPASTLRLWNARGHLFIVADGMGAHAAGERASELATKVVSQSYLKRTNENPPEALKNAILEAHSVIKKQGESDLSFENMGTTCDALVLFPDRGYIGHVGDSRVYRVRDRVVEQMTFDHSLVWEVKYNPSAHSALRQVAHIPKNVITRSLGPTENLVVDVEGPFKTKPGDAFLLCSDGLSGQVSDTEIGQVLEIFQPEDATESLVNLANLRGGPDNVTVVVARVKSVSKSEEIDQEIKKSTKVYEKRPPLSAVALGAAITACVLWALAGVLLLIREDAQWFMAVKIGAAVAAAISTTVFFVLGRASIFRGAFSDQNEQKLGKGPYIRASAAPTREFHDNIDAVCDELCLVLKNDEESAKIGFKPDWKGIDEARKQAKSAAASEDYTTSIRANFSVVNYVMREYKKNSPQRKNGR